MFATLFSVALFLVLVQVVTAQGTGFMIDTPSLVQCQPAQLTWTATANPPYDLLVVAADDVCGPALEDLGNQTSLSVTWTVNIDAGAQVVLSLLDAADNEAWSGTITVGASNDTSCLENTPSPSTAPPSVGTTLTIPNNANTPFTAPTSSALPSAGAVNDGSSPTSGALMTRPLGAATLVGSAVVAFVAFAL